MSKPPEPSGSSMSQPGWGAPEPDRPLPLPRLKTISPRSNRATDSDSVKPKRRSTSVSQNADLSPSQSKTHPQSLSFLDRGEVDEKALKTFLPQSNADEESPESVSISQHFRRHRNPLSSFLTSTIVHVGLLVSLAMFMLSWPTPDPQISILAVIDSTPVPEKPKENDQTFVIEAPKETESPIENAFEEISDSEEVKIADTIAETLPSVVEAEATSPAVEKHEPVPSEKIAAPVGGGLKGRDATARANLASKFGGSKASESAVENGLRWIIAHQRDDGSWRLKHDAGQCNGHCHNEGLQESTTGATGLALMALLGAGYTHQVGPYQKEVDAGLDYLMSKMRVSGHGGSLASGEKGMYGHAIATIALSEAYILTGDTELMHPIELARKYIESAQHKKGGWRYNPGTLGDLSVTGWQIMALKSCEMASAPSGEVTWDRAKEFVDSLGSSGGKFGYAEPSEAHPTMTAVGLLSKIYLGANFGDPGVSAGADFLSHIGPAENDIYYNYYATLTLHHRQGESWKLWNSKLRDYLVQTQDKNNGHSSGSWHFPNPHGDVGGRLYSTAMAIMTLEVYYRYMPIYGHRVE